MAVVSAEVRAGMRKALLAIAVTVVAVTGVNGSKEEPIAETTVRCYSSGAWFDVCSYENLCFSAEGPRHLMFISNEPNKFTKVHRGSQRIVATTKLLRDIRYPREDRVAPEQYATASTQGVTPDWVARHSKDVVWFDTPTYIPSYFERLGNIWYYSSRVLPLFNAAQHPEWNLPPMDHVLLPAAEEKVHYDWHHNILKYATEPHTKIFYNSDAPYNGLLHLNKAACFKKVVLLGATMYGFDSMMTGYKFREKVWSALNMTVPRAAKPPSTVTILDRGRTRPRHFLNVKDMMDMMERYNVTANRVIIENKVTFKEQVELMANTGVLVTMHGAGLMNEIFMPPGSAVIEIFPVHLKHVLYERVAHYAGVYHFKVYARKFAKGYHRLHKEYMRYSCDNITALGMSDNANCWMAVKNANIVTPMPEFEVAFVQACDHSSMRMKLDYDHSNDDLALFE